MAINVLAAAGCLIWIYLLFGRRGFWRVREETAPPPVPAGRQPRVAVVIPARNEADVVGRAVASVLRSSYPTRVYLADDHSTDGTAQSAEAAAEEHGRLTVIRAEPLPPGWTGKLWAVSQGIREAAKDVPDYYLLTDADIEHAQEEMARLVARAEAGALDLASLMVKLRCESAAEKALIPAFVFFFFKLYPPGPRTWGAAGGCILIRRKALEDIGGVEAIRGELIDDCALAREVKRRGGRVWLGVTRGTRSIRDYGSFAEVEKMIARTAFTQLGYSAWMLAGAILGMTLTYVLPPVLALAGNPFGLAAWLLMTIAYVPVLRFYGRPVWWAPLLPLVALFYLGATLHSAVRYWRGKGGLWKGRVQAR